MIIGFVGLPENTSRYTLKRHGSLKGIGKTTAETFFGLLQSNEGRRVFSNYWTDFSYQMSFADFVNIIRSDKSKKLNNFTYLCDEIHNSISSLGERSDRIAFYTSFVTQIRKRNGDLFYSLQRAMDLVKPIRDNTDIVFTCEKYHYNNTICPIDRCSEPHYIKLFMIKPEYRVLDLRIDAALVGEHFDTNEIIEREYISDKILESVL